MLRMINSIMEVFLQNLGECVSVVMSANSCLHLCGQCGQGEVSGGVLRVLSKIGSIMEVIPQLLGESVTARVSANSCLHLGGRLGL